MCIDTGGVRLSLSQGCSLKSSRLGVSRLIKHTPSVASENRTCIVASVVEGKTVKCTLRELLLKIIVQIHGEYYSWSLLTLCCCCVSGCDSWEINSVMSTVVVHVLFHEWKINLFVLHYD